MAYQSTVWKETHKTRTDLTGLLTHLTRRQDDLHLSAVDVLILILNERLIKASSKGFIVGNSKVICFQEAPLYAVAENAINHVENYEKNKSMRLRYDACGLAIHKVSISQLFDSSSNLPIPGQGVRPVVYEKTELAKSFLPPEQHWRIVDHDLTKLWENGPITDWTHEREWRILGDLKLLHLEPITILLRNVKEYKEFINKVDQEILKQIGGIVVLESLLY